MSAIFGELAATLVCVALAAAFLVRRSLRAWRENSGCSTGSCGTCPGGRPHGADGFVPLETLRNSARSDRPAN